MRAAQCLIGELKSLNLQKNCDISLAKNQNCERSEKFATYDGLVSDFGYENAINVNELVDELTNVPLTHFELATYGVMSMRTKNEFECEKCDQPSHQTALVAYIPCHYTKQTRFKFKQIDVLLLIYTGNFVKRALTTGSDAGSYGKILLPRIVAPTHVPLTVHVAFS